MKKILIILGLVLGIFTSSFAYDIRILEKFVYKEVVITINAKGTVIDLSGILWEIVSQKEDKEETNTHSTKKQDKYPVIEKNEISSKTLNKCYIILKKKEDMKIEYYIDVDNIIYIAYNRRY